MEEIKPEINIETAESKDVPQSKPLSFGNYLTLPLTEEEIDLHTSHILKRVNEILEDPERVEMMANVEGWRNQYEGKVEQTNFPWVGAFNLDTGLTPKIQDAVVAQTQEAFDDVDPRWSVGPVLNMQMLDERQKQEKVLDYYEDIEMNNREDKEAIDHDAYLFGLGWEAILFEIKYDRVRDFRVYHKLEDFIGDFPNDYPKYPQYLQDLSAGKTVKIIVEENRETRRSPIRKHIEFEDAICPSDAKGVEGVNSADCVGRRVWKKWHEIKQLEDEGDYIKGVSDRLKYHSDLDKEGRLVEDPDYLNKSYETFEIMYSVYITIDGKRRRVKCLFNIEKEHAVCLRAIRYPFDHTRAYLIPHCITYTKKGLYQTGMGSMLQDVHIAGNATINHILNASTLANSLSLKSREGSGAAKRIMEHRWYPGSVLELQNMDDAQQFNFATPNLASLIQLFGIIQGFAADRSGIVNYQLGVESPEDPTAPASKTIALMRKAEIKLRRYIKNLKRSEDEAGYQSLRLIYQFTPKDRLSEILGEDVDESKSFLKPSMRVVTNSTGFAIEKIFEKRDDMQMGINLLKDPMVMNDEVRRARLWHMVAKSQGSNWDKKIIGIMPTPEEIQQKQAQAAQAKQQKKMEVIQQAAIKVLQAGGDENAAKEAGLQAGEMFNTMSQRQDMMNQQAVPGAKQ